MNTDLILSDIFKASRREMLQYAFWRIESAIVIAFTIVMTGLSLLNIFFIPEMGWMWLAFGVLGEAALIYTGTQDKALMAKLASKLFYAHLGPNKLHTPQLKHAMSAALDFHRGVFGVVTSGKFTNMGELAIDMDHWVVHVFRIVGHLDQVIMTPSILPPLPPTVIKTHLTQLSSVEAFTCGVSEISKVVNTLKPEDTARLQYVQNAVTQAKTQVDGSLNQVHQIYTQLSQGTHRGKESIFVQQFRDMMVEQFALFERFDRPLEVLLPLATAAAK